MASTERFTWQDWGQIRIEQGMIAKTSCHGAKNIVNNLESCDAERYPWGLVIAIVAVGCHKRGSHMLTQSSVFSFRNGASEQEGPLRQGIYY